MSSAGAKRLIVGLGNPGVRYAATRHNYGFRLVEAFAKKEGWKLKRGVLRRDALAVERWGEMKVILLLPMSYMNLSGGVVAKYVRYYDVALEELLVVVDDVDVEFGKMRLRPGGSSGGHNGLKSVESALGTSVYARLRMGIGSKERGRQALESFVLDKFSAEEETRLPELVEQGVSLLEVWMSQGMAKALQEGKRYE